MSRLRTSLSWLWRTLLADLDLYALVVAGLLFAVLGVVGIADTKTLSSVVLTGLTLLAFSMARTRRLMAEPMSRPSKVSSVFLDDFPEELYERRRIERRTYIFVGISGNRTVGTGAPDFQDMLDRGATLRFVMLDFRNDDAVRDLNKTGHSRSAPDRVSTRISQALYGLSRLRTKEPERLQVRLIQFAPAFCINAFDMHGATGEIYVQQYIRGVTRERSPIFKVDRDDGMWFDHYREETERLWQLAKPFELTDE